MVHESGSRQTGRKAWWFKLNRGVGGQPTLFPMQTIRSL
jgi:hypothetical protein